MKTLSYNIEIYATKEKIWDILFNPTTYSQWTHYFSPDSVLKTDWAVDGKTYFLAKNGDGMISTIDSIDHPNSVVFKHLGIIKDGVEDTNSKEVEDWSGLQEKYFLIDLVDHVKLQAEVQTYEEYESIMNNGFEKGLAIIKQLAES